MSAGNWTDDSARVERFTTLATETFGDSERAANWLGTPNRALGGAVPRDLLGSDEGERIVRETLIRLGHGIFA